MAALLALAVGMVLPFVCPMADCAATSEHACCPPDDVTLTLEAGSCCEPTTVASDPATLTASLDAGAVGIANVDGLSLPRPTASAAHLPAGPPPTRPPALAASTQVLLI